MAVATRLRAGPQPGAFRRGLRRLAEAAASPLVPADFLDVVDPLRNSSALRGRVVAVNPETPDAVTLVIRPGRGWSGHIPGQYVRIGIDVDGVRQWRAYSVTSPTDRADGHLTITVKQIPDGTVSTHIVRDLRPGTVIQLDQATGDFHLPNPLPSKILFVTAGSGITPVMGMLRSTVLPDAVLVHSAPTPPDVIFGDELRILARLGRIRLIERHTDVDGMVTAAQIAELVPDFAERQTWACGPTGLLDALDDTWSAAGISDALHTERFRPHVAETGEGGEVTFTRTGVTVDVDGGKTLLDAGEEAGVLMPSGCRMGICFGCVVPLEQGAVRDLRSGEVTSAAPGDCVIIQTCISAAAGACHIDL